MLVITGMPATSAQSATRSRISTIKRSAVFLPMPGSVVRRVASFRCTQATNSSTCMPDSTASAIRAPMPLTFNKLWNRARSASVPKPKRWCASSRTTRCVCSVTSCPASGSAQIVDIGASIS